MSDEPTIYLCIPKDLATRAVHGSIEQKCADCGVTILRKPDPGVPDDALYVCMTCGMKRIDESDEVPELMITKQNEQTLKQLGYKIRPADGEC